MSKKQTKVKCECSAPGCKNIEDHIRKLRVLGEDDEVMLEMIRSGELRSKILKKDEPV